MLNKNLDPGISKRTRNSSVTMVNLKSFPDGKSALLTGAYRDAGDAPHPALEKNSKWFGHKG